MLLRGQISRGEGAADKTDSRRRLASYYLQGQQAGEEEGEEEEEESDWRRGAQMLSERDERRLLLLGTPDELLAGGEDALDVAPVNRRRQQPSARTPSPRQPQQQQVRHHKLAFFSASPSPRPEQQQRGGKRLQKQRQDELDFLAGPELGERGREEEEGDLDEQSSISLAQSGCHSILSAWRVRAANRAARLSGASRPLSVLSGASTAATNWSRPNKSAGQQARISLGPKSAQHFVTNSRRRRRANELILSTLEARRRALALNRQNGLDGVASLFGSGSYLNAGEPSQMVPDYQRLSMSPSPLGDRARATPSPLQAKQLQVRALSDLGGGAVAGHRASSPAATLAQRQRLLDDALLKQLNKSPKRRTGAGSARRPPLARLDQNSSDLNSNSSASESSSSPERRSSSSSGSQFTQLVSAELAPECVVLDQQAMGARQQVAPRAGSRPDEREQKQKQQQQQQVGPARPLGRSPEPPPVPARPSRGRPASSKELVSEPSTHMNGSFRRGALKRDSIRRLRLSRAAQASAQSAAGADSSSLSDANAAQSQQQQQQEARVVGGELQLGAAKMQPLSKSRKLDIETNPFLNRHHFRSLSTRSSALLGGAQTSSGSGESQAAGEGEHQSRNFVRSASSRDQAHLKQPQQQQQQNQQLAPTSRLAADQAAQFNARARAASNSRERLNPSPTSNRPQKVAPEVPRRLRLAPGGPTMHTPAGGQPNARLVREGSSSRDDLKFDAQGNRRRLELEQHWRHEQTVRPLRRLQDGSLLSEQKHLSSKLKIERTTSIERLEPPEAFADQVRLAPRKPARGQATRSPSPAPPAPARASSLLAQDKAVGATTTSGGGGGGEPLTRRSLWNQQAQSLPKFERSADEEFRKRVEQLRQMARANLASEPEIVRERQRQEQQARSRQTDQQQPKQQKRQMARPMSTNWTGLDRRAPAEEELSSGDRPSQVASTNLDDMLLAGGYQRPLPLGAWRRSNSSLASVGRREPTGVAAESAALGPSGSLASQRVESGGGGGSQQSLSQSELSSGPTGRPGQSPMRLIVRERSGPRLNVASMLEAQRGPHPAPPVAPAVRRVMAAGGAPAAARRAPSPRSPDQGGQANSSSADDSAIASSVSSPSLSCGAQLRHQPSASTKATAPPTTSSSGAQLDARRRPEQVTISSQPSSGALQSILRRQQQQLMHFERDPRPSALSPPEAQLRPAADSAELRRQELASLPPVAGPQAQQPVAAAAAAGAKRVHFNERASIRSFESISSLAESESAALAPAGEPSAASRLQQQHFARQLLGSPDSMGSASSASRLSAESPDSYGRPAARLGALSPGQPSGGGGGAAIYAVRGDPELDEHPAELAPPSSQPQQQQQQPSPATRMTLGQAQMMHYNVRGGSNGGGVSSAQQLANYAPRASVGPAIRMTASPSIGTNAATMAPIVSPHLQQQRRPMQFQQQHFLAQRFSAPGAALARPAALAPTAPGLRATPSSGSVDEDQEYALRLRQAAASRALLSAYASQPAGVAQVAAPASSQQHQQFQQQLSAARPQPQKRRDLRNFQTEV